MVYFPLIEASFEKRGEIIRLVRTLRGGDAVAIGYQSIGIERDPDFFQMAQRAIPHLAQLQAQKLDDEKRAMLHAIRAAR